MKTNQLARFICVTILLIASVSVYLTLPSRAENNNGDTQITGIAISGNGGNTIWQTPRGKWDSSAMYIWIDTSTHDYQWVRALGTNVTSSLNAANTLNCTCLYDWEVVYPHVTCYWNVQHSVHSGVWERGKSYATFDFINPFSTYEYLHAWWSPDSIYSHTDALP